MGKLKDYIAGLTTKASPATTDRILWYDDAGNASKAQTKTQMVADLASEIDAANLAANNARYAQLGAANTFADTVFEDPSPIVELKDSNGPADRKRIYWFKNGAVTYWRSVTDAGVKIRDWFDFDDDTGDLDMSEAVSLTFPETINPKATATQIRFEGLVSAARRVINAQASSYTFVLSDSGTIVTSTGASAASFTVPSDSSVDFQIGSQIDVIQTGAGALTIVADSGVVINTPRTLQLRTQHSAATLVKTSNAGSGIWQLLGDLAA